MGELGLTEPSAVLAALGLQGVNPGVYGGTQVGGAWSGGGPTVETLDPSTGKVCGVGGPLCPGHVSTCFSTMELNKLEHGLTCFNNMVLEPCECFQGWEAAGSCQPLTSVLSMREKHDWNRFIPCRTFYPVGNSSL